MENDRILGTDRRIRLGIWGLGRGMSFYGICHALNFDVVAGCDYAAHMRERFHAANPGAFVTDDAREFLARDFDAVLVSPRSARPTRATPSRALEAGKHVLSEVTAFHTMAEGVRLVEAVETVGPTSTTCRELPLDPGNHAGWAEEVEGRAVRRAACTPSASTFTTCRARCLHLH